MSFITGKHLPRRTFLRGMGATVALPFLDAMAPAGRLGRTVAASTADVTRLVCIEEVHGLPGCNEWGASRHLFAPTTVGADFELLPDNALKSLEPFRDYLTVVSNTDVRMAEAFSPPEIGGAGPIHTGPSTASSIWECRGGRAPFTLPGGRECGAGRSPPPRRSTPSFPDP